MQYIFLKNYITGLKNKMSYFYFPFTAFNHVGKIYPVALKVSANNHDCSVSYSSYESSVFYI